MWEIGWNWGRDRVVRVRVCGVRLWSFRCRSRLPLLDRIWVMVDYS